MESLKEKMKGMVFVAQSSQIKPSKLQSWQEYALEVIKEFGIEKSFQGMIFRYAKQNKEYLKGKVENTREKFGNKELGSKGHYLISLFRKKKPWDAPSLDKTSQ